MLCALTLSFVLTGLGQNTDKVPVKTTFPLGTSTLIESKALAPSAKKTSPKFGWEFSHCAIVSKMEDDLSTSDRFRVFSQSIEHPVARPDTVARMLCRLYDFNMTVLRLEHNSLFGGRVVDVYLCNEGTPGGEQMFGVDSGTTDVYGRPMKVNTIYLYDVDTLDNPLEACRETAHEYGHATLPPVKVPKGREEWANGHLGERIYLSWLRRAIKQGDLETSDAMGATLADLDVYWNSKVKPLVLRAAKNGIDPRSFQAGGEKAFDAYLALALYASTILPEEAFRRSLLLNDVETPMGYFKAVTEVCNERPSISIQVPNLGIPEIWIPVGSGQVTGAKVLSKSNGWAKVRPLGKVSIVNKTKL